MEDAVRNVDDEEQVQYSEEDDEQQDHDQQMTMLSAYDPQKKSMLDIHALMNVGVGMDVIAKQLKNISTSDLKKISENKQMQQLHMMGVNQRSEQQFFAQVAQDAEMGVEQPLNLQQPLMTHGLMNHLVNQPGMLANFVLPSHMKKDDDMDKSKKPRKKSWKESEFPPDHRGTYYCLDCQMSSRVRDCTCGRASWKWCNFCQKYQQPSYHYHFVQNRKKIRKKWKIEDFPNEKRGGEDFAYFCGDCKKGNRLFDCECGRKCWKWCDECSCYKQAANHSHFLKERKKKRKRWTTKSFPLQRLAKYYCLDCKKANDTRKCTCGRDGWRWCEDCVKYLSKSHYHFKKRGKKNKDNDFVRKAMSMEPRNSLLEEQANLVEQEQLQLAHNLAAMEHYPMNASVLQQTHANANYPYRMNHMMELELSQEIQMQQQQMQHEVDDHSLEPPRKKRKLE